MPYYYLQLRLADRRLTCGGDTSGIITNGTGPRPMAKDLDTAVSIVQTRLTRDVRNERDDGHGCQGNVAGINPESDTP